MNWVNKWTFHHVSQALPSLFWSTPGKLTKMVWALSSLFRLPLRCISISGSLYSIFIYKLKATRFEYLERVALISKTRTLSGPCFQFAWLSCRINDLMRLPIILSTLLGWNLTLTILSSVRCDCLLYCFW